MHVYISKYAPADTEESKQHLVVRFGPGSVHSSGGLFVVWRKTEVVQRVRPVLRPLSSSIPSDV